LVLISSSTSLHADELNVVPEQSVFAVVTHKGGIAGGLAHDHLITASGFTARLVFTDSDPLAAEFAIRFAAENLVVDSEALRKNWSSRLQALGILDEPFGRLSDEDRMKIRETMLGAKQLNVAGFPEISARILSIDEEASSQGDIQLSHRIALAFRVHGQTVERPVWARYEYVGGELRVEAVGEFRFQDFGIEPYSAMLGAIKNKDEFHLYMNLVATSGNE
jgi:hypothetical protein